jgi:hypothetical protein
MTMSKFIMVALAVAIALVVAVPTSAAPTTTGPQLASYFGAVTKARAPLATFKSEGAANYENTMREFRTLDRLNDQVAIRTAAVKPTAELRVAHAKLMKAYQLQSDLFHYLARTGGDFGGATGYVTQSNQRFRDYRNAALGRQRLGVRPPLAGATLPFACHTATAGRTTPATGHKETRRFQRVLRWS